jgi:Tol biopolymer transport system component
VWIMAADGTDPHPASPEAPSCPWGFATLTWDPAGTRVAAQCFWVVSVLDLRTGAATALPTSLEDTMQDPDWSPDGTRIAFGDPFRPAIFTRSPGGGERTDLMQDAADPAWSPDGRRIAFIGAGNAAPGLYIANADGSRRVHLTSPEQAVDEGPTWSPDGQWLAFHRRGTRCTSDPEPSRICFPQWGVFVVRTDGSGLRSITPDSLQATRPAW